MSLSDEMEDGSEDEFEDEIEDEFGDLSPAERSETMASSLSEFAKVMCDNNQQIFSRVLDMIAETEGDDKLHLDMLATHLDIEDPRYIDFKSWDMPEITSFSDYRARTRLGDNDGGFMSGPSDYTAGYLSGLKIAVRKHASRDLLGSMAENLDLPAEFTAFLEHTSGVEYLNLDKRMFVCSFSTALYSPEEQAQPLDKLREGPGCEDFEVAAGWMAGDNDMSSRIYYLLCKDYDEPDEPWRWRVFYMNYKFGDGGHFDSLREFLSWYCNAYDWVVWDAVQGGIESLHYRCVNALAEEALEKEQMAE
jgi:hypothetical protein